MRASTFTAPLIVIALSAVAAPVSAQSRVYVGGIVAADSGDRGGVELGTFPAAGGLVGLRLSDNWSIELHLDRGFRDGTPHGRPGFFGIDSLQDHAGRGRTALVTWRFFQAGRIGAAASAGFSSRRFQTVRTVGVAPGVVLPPDDVLLQTQTTTTEAAGLTGGLFLPVALGSGFSIAPEVRATFGFTSDGVYQDGLYRHLYSGVRVMWGF